MINRYRETLSNIKASDEKKKEIIDNIGKTMNSYSSVAVEGKKFTQMRSIGLVTSIACLICVCIVLSVVFIPAHSGGEQNTRSYGIGDIFERIDGGTIVFNSIKLDKVSYDSDDYILIMNGDFDLELFSVPEDGIELRCFRLDKKTDVDSEFEFCFDSELTFSMSEVNLNIGLDQDKVAGKCSIVFRLTKELGYEMIQRIKSDLSKYLWQIELSIAGCETYLEKPLFTFTFDQILLGEYI